MVKHPDGSETLQYCGDCHQVIRYRKKDKKWVHTGYNRIHEPYSWFLERTNHPIDESKIFNINWKGSRVTVAE